MQENAEEWTKTAGLRTRRLARGRFVSASACTLICSAEVGLG